jgi:hypothetical protein
MHRFQLNLFRLILDILVKGEVKSTMEEQSNNEKSNQQDRNQQRFRGGRALCQFVVGAGAAE